MIRKVFKKKNNSNKFDRFIEKYKIPRDALSINRRSVSRGLLIGIFIGFIPMPFQMIAVLAVLPFLKFNVPIAFSMVWLSNPVTMPFMYYIEYLTGNWLLMREETIAVELTMEWFQSHWDEIVVPLYVGALFFSVTVSSAVYYLATHLWIKSVKKEKADKQ